VEFLLTAGAVNIQFRGILWSAADLSSSHVAFCMCVCVCVCVRLRGWLQGVSEDGIPRVKKIQKERKCLLSIVAGFPFAKQLCAPTHTHTHTHTYQRRNKEPRLWYQNMYERSGPARCDRETALAVITLQALSSPHLFLV